MPGNRALFDRAMEQSRDAARQKNWDEALKQAVRALQEFPQDPDARSSAAVPLFNTGKYPQALQVFEELRRGDQNNPFFLEYLARIHEQMKNIPQAVNSYTQLADLQQSRRLSTKASEALREALRLDSSAGTLRMRLARLLESSGSGSEAATEYLELARRQSNPEEAVKLAETALQLDPNGPLSREIKEMIASLHDQLANAAQSAINEAVSSGSAPPPQIMGTGGMRGQQMVIDKIVAQAQERQEAGDSDGAIEHYEQAVKLGAERSDVFYSLGLLYQERGNHQRAVELLPRAAQDDEYALSAHFMLGQSYQELGKLQEAAQEYEQTIRLLPLESIGKAESEDMIQMYESAVLVYTQMNDVARAATLYSTLANFLQSKRWGKERADEFRQKAKELTERNMFAKLRSIGTGALRGPESTPAPPPPPTETMPETWGKIKPITDFLRADRVAELKDQNIFPPVTSPPPPAPGPLATIDDLPPVERPAFAPVTKLDTTGLDELTQRYVMASEQYIEQGLTLAAMDACLEIIKLNQDYLPIHLRMGEIYEREERNEEALQKYQLLIDTYTARSEPQRAIDVYYRLIELSPDTINARSRLAELLKNDGRAPAAAEQISMVASTYFRMGQTNKAMEEYRRGLQWAPNSPALRTQYGQALLKMERYEAALDEFRRALELDQHSLTGIARINITLALMGDQPAAIWQSMATLLEQLKSQTQQSNDIQAEYRSALLSADEAILHYILGIVQQSMAQHQSALMEFEQAQALLEEAPVAFLPIALVYQAMADSYIALGQADDARAHLQKCLAAPPAQAQPDNTRYPFATPLSKGEVVRRMAEAYAATGDLSGAERALIEAKQHLPYDRAIYTKLADVYFRQGKLTEALTQLEELATYYESRQDLDRAIEALENAAKLAPNNVTIGNRLARMHIRRGYLDKGVDGLMRVAEMQRRAGQLRDAVVSLQDAAEIHSTLRQNDKAMAIYDKIIQVAPNDLDARRWLAVQHMLSLRTAAAVAEKKHIVRICLQQRNYEEATEELFTIIAMDQSDTDAHFQLGDVLMRRNEYDQALRIYARLAKMPGIDIERVEALQAAAKRMLDVQQAQKK